jgi:hypothetical protein
MTDTQSKIRARIAELQIMHDHPETATEGAILSLLIAELEAVLKSLAEEEGTEQKEQV